MTEENDGVVAGEIDWNWDVLRSGESAETN